MSSLCRELTLNNADAQYICLASPELQQLTWKWHSDFDNLKMHALAKLTSLTRLEVQVYDYLPHPRPWQLIHSLGLKELVLTGCTNFATHVISFGAFPALERLQINERSNKATTEAIATEAKARDDEISASAYKQLRDVIIDHPKLVELSGNGKLFVLAAEEGLEGWVQCVKASEALFEGHVHYISKSSDVWRKRS